MQYGAMNFPVLPVVSEIEAFAELGFDYLELALDPPKAHYSEVRRQKDEILASLRRHRMGLICHLPTFVYTADLTESIRRASLHEMLESLETAAQLGVAKAVVHPGLINGLAPYVLQTARGFAMESLAAIVARGERLGICLCLENMFSKYQSFVEPDDFMEVFGIFPGLKMTLDTGHAHIHDPSGRRLLTFIERFGHRLGHIHVSDNHGQSDEHLALGDGSIKFSKVVKALQNTGYDDTITLEVFCENRRKLMESRRQLAALWSR
jgi:sugar phosphate isomerase/epimerase